LFDCNIHKIKFILQLDEPQQGTSVSHSTQPGTSASHSTQRGTSTSHTTEPIDWSTYTPAKLMSSKLNSKLCGSSKNMSLQQTLQLRALP
jgi:hypothetical protein